jgi:hypothetical protein
MRARFPKEAVLGNRPTSCYMRVSRRCFLVTQEWLTEEEELGGGMAPAHFLDLENPKSVMS